jgi:hypothetical protein
MRAEHTETRWCAEQRRWTSTWVSDDEGERWLTCQSCFGSERDDGRRRDKCRRCGVEAEVYVAGPRAGLCSDACWWAEHPELREGSTRASAEPPAPTVAEDPGGIAAERDRALAEVESLRENAAELVHDREVAEAEVARVRGELAAMRNERDQYIARAMRAETERAQAQRELSSVRSRPLAIQQRDEARAEVERLAAEVARLRTRVQAMEWDRDEACENTPTRGCECPGCMTARERAGASR